MQRILSVTNRGGGERMPGEAPEVECIWHRHNFFIHYHNLLINWPVIIYLIIMTSKINSTQDSSHL